MNVSHKWLQRYFNEELPDVSKLEELFTVHSFEVDGIDEINADKIIDADITPDRAHYLLGHKGFAKEIEILTDLKIKEKEIKSFDVSNIPEPEVKIESDLCRRYMARRIENITVQDTTSNIKELLENIGQRTINNIVDSGNFVMFDIGQPLHTFDADKVQGSITIRLASKGEKIVILGGEEKELSETDLVIADKVGPIAIAGVKGGARAEVTKDTKNIIIEAANFDPATVRMTSNKLSLRNDSSKRYENEITPDRVEQGMNDITGLILESNPKAKIGKIIDVYTNPVQPWTISVSIKKIESILGEEVGIQKAQNILERMDSKVEIKGDTLHVTPPLERLDMKIPADIADEVGRIIGYEHISSKLTPEIENPVKTDEIYYYSELIKNILVQAGFSETILYTLVNKGEFYVQKPLASDKGALRTTATSKMAESLLVNSRNADFLALDAIKLFEIGQVFTKAGEKTYLTIGVKQVKKQKGVSSELILKEAVENINESLSISLEGNLMNGEYGAMIEFELDRVIAQLSKPQSISGLNFKSLPEGIEYKLFSAFPFITRDIAVFVPKEKSAEEILNTILEKAGGLCVKSYLFDVYEKDDKVSYAFRLIFQSFEKTLTDEEINPIVENIHKELENKSWEVR